MEDHYTDDLERFASIFGDLELEPLQGDQFLFVYGTLMHGERNHHRMRVPGIEYIGGTQTEYYQYTLYAKLAFGGYAPVMVRGGNHRIAGEVYLVSGELMQELDMFEGHPEVYRRGKITLVQPHDEMPTEAWAYLYHRDASKLKAQGVFPCPQKNTFSWSGKSL